MNAMSTENPGESVEAEGGPMWGRFFDSIGGHDDTESVVSGSHVPTDGLSTHNITRLQQSPHSEVHPNDSASVVDEEHESGLEGYSRKRQGTIPAITGATASVPIDDGTYVFKFRTPSGRTHRFQARHDSVEMLREIVQGKLATDPFFTEFAGSPTERPDPEDFTLSYTDADADTVLITSDTDIADAVKIARSAGSDRVVLFIQGGKHWIEAGAEKGEAKAAEVNAAAKEEEKEVEKAEAVTIPEPVVTPPVKAYTPPQEELVMGIPKDLLLPASIGALAVVIIAVFTISRLAHD
jgi:hypothetical protein